MLISHSKNFIFVHNYKVAGTSIRYALDKYADRSFIRASIKSKLNHLVGKYPNIYSENFNLHSKALELKDELPEEIFSSYFKFGFVRNPWDWEVSLYTYMKKKKDHRQRDVALGFKDFDEYIDWRVNEDLHFQKDFFYDKQGNKLVDYIGKFETIREDFGHICKKIGIEGIELPHTNQSKKQSYLTYYSEKTLDIVYEALKPDIELFGYEKPKLPVENP